MADRTRLDDLTSDDLDALYDRLSLLEAGRDERAALLEEARDALEQAGQRGAHGDDWPAIAPAIRALAAERDQLAARLRDVLAVAEVIDANGVGWAADSVHRAIGELTTTLPTPATEENP